MKTRHSLRWGRIFFIGIFLLSSILTSSPVAASNLSDSKIPAFSDGEWLGKFSMYTHSSTKVMDMVTNYKGDAGFLSTGGKLAGEWVLTGSSSYTGDIQGSAKFDAGGKVTGTSYALQFVTSKFIAHMNVSVGGVSTTQDVDFGTGAGMELLLKSATCSQATADISSVVAKQYQSAGMQAQVSGSFTAIRKGDLKASNQVDYMNAVGELLDKAEAYKQKLKEGQVTSYSELNDIVSQADSLNLAIRKNIQCGLAGKKQYLTIITNVVADIAYLALENPHLMTTDQLNRLLFVAVEAGATGSGAVNTEQAADLGAKFLQEFTDRLNDAKENKNCYDATIIELAAGMLGNEALKQEAQSVAEMC
jgi:hypothetical protein